MNNCKTKNSYRNIEIDSVDPHNQLLLLLYYYYYYYDDDYYYD